MTERGIVRLEKEKIRPGKFYSVGYLPVLNKYVMAVGVVSGLSIFERHFVISKEEYELFEKKVKKLDSMAWVFIWQGKTSDRFLFSGRRKENTLEQHKLRERAVAGIVDL